MQPARQHQDRDGRAAVPGAEIKLAEDGEILIKGPFIMPGYRNNEEKTRETIDEDGWLHTGDVGEFDDDGFLKIVDRKKELIINAAGKNMSPANIEAKLKAAGPLIGQAIAIGDSKPFNVALLTLDPDSAPRSRRRTGSTTPRSTLARENEKVLEAFRRKWTRPTSRWRASSRSRSGSCFRPSGSPAARS